MSIAYKVQVIKFTAPNAYHVVCLNTKVSHSMWPTYEQAMACMRDLNRQARESARRAA